MRLRVLTIASLLAGLCGLAVAGCGGGQPDVPGLIGSSLRAASQQKDLRVHYAVTATVDATPSAHASAETRKFLSQPVSLKASGGLSKDALTFVGNLAFGGGHYDARALVGRNETYVNLLGAWYGDTTKGLNDLQDTTKAKTGADTDPTALRKTLRWVYDHSDEVLDATVTRGPDIDGPTWQAQGHCRPAAVVALAERNGTTMTAQDRDRVAQFCRVTELTYVIGQDDDLPRAVRITADLDRATLRALASGDASTAELDGLKLSLEIKLTKWGDDVEYTAPRDPKPMQDLGMAVLGLLFQAAA